MKRAILTTIIILGLAVVPGYAQMGGGHMSDQGMMSSPGYGETKGYDRSQYPGMGSGMMGPGMMGYGECGMMGSGHMGGRGMMGQGRMGGYGMMGQGHMGGMMGSGGYGMRGYDAETYEKYQEKYQKFLDETASLRKKLHNKKFDYSEAIRNPDTTRATMLKIEKEILDLKWEIYEKSPR
jgi:hypothetical protein